MSSIAMLGQRLIAFTDYISCSVLQDLVILIQIAINFSQFVKVLPTVSIVRPSFYGLANPRPTRPQLLSDSSIPNRDSGPR